MLNVARYDVFKLSDAVLSGQLLRVQRMLDGLQAEGEAAVLVHWTLAEDIRTLARARTALDNGKPLPMALKDIAPAVLKAQAGKPPGSVAGPSPGWAGTMWSICVLVSRWRCVLSSGRPVTACSTAIFWNMKIKA